MIKQILLLLVTIIFLTSCDQHILDKPFYEVSYEKDFVELANDPGVKKDDLFYMNYSITRHRDYFNYEVEGVKYYELIKQARELKENGIDVVQKFDEVDFPEGLSMSITDIRQTVLPKKNRPTRKVKHLRFSCTFSNISSEDIALNYASFVINGPFGHHLTTAGYEVNCKIPARKAIRMHFIMEARKIRANLLFGKSNDVDRLMFNDLFEKMQVKVSGVEVDDTPEFYETCFRGSSVIEPFAYTKYRELFPDGIKAEEIDGKTTVHYGPSLFTRNNEDEIIQYK